VLDTTTFVVLGEGLAAGMSNFSLQAVHQQDSFSALAARQMGAIFPQPLIQAPGLGSAPGFAENPVVVPAVGQTTVRTPFPPTLFVFNLAVPGHSLSDALRMRPRAPLVHPANSKQTVTNLLLGFPSMIFGPNIPLWTQAEYAVAMNPTLVLVSLGYAEVLEAASQGIPELVPDATQFRSDYSELLSKLRENQAEVIITSIPSPLDTAYFSTLSSAAQLTRRSVPEIASRYGLASTDLLSPGALINIGTNSDLPPGAILPAAVAVQIQSRLRSLNAEIASFAQQPGVIFLDLNDQFARIKAAGLAVGSIRLTADYLGGIFSLNGFYPGATGQALIANSLLALINRTYGTSFPLVDLAPILAGDPSVRIRLASELETPE
jgi:hypothetical protein